MSERNPQRSEPLAGELVVRTGPDRGISRSLLVPVTLIGSHENCDLRILEPDVRSVHCAVSVTPDGPHLRSVGGTTLVNGIPASGRLLRTGDVLTIGALDLEVHWRLPPGPTPNSMAVLPWSKLIDPTPDDPAGDPEPARRSAARRTAG